MNAASLAQLSPDDKEAFHRGVEATVQTFAYERGPSSREKDIVPLVKTTLMKVAVQVVHEGGENNLHYHLNSDTTWFVLKGNVRFYGPGDAVIAELGPHEGITIPGGARYWFETTGAEDLEILQMVAYDRASGKAERINVDAHKDWMTEAELRVYESSASTS
jgi:mannose-6-phosphate isomerase-like protein (cupin superfamily)